MSGRRLDLAVVIVSWNVRDLLAKCLEALQSEIAAAGVSAETWVVDNASKDDSVEMLRRRFPAIQIIANADNRGFAAANNQALRAIGFDANAVGARLVRAQADTPAYVLLLNPDTTLQTGALATWLQTAQAWPAAGVIGPSLRYPDGQFQHSAFAFPTLWQIFFDFYPLHHRLIGSRLNGRYPRARYAAGRPFGIAHPLGAAMLIRREAIQAAGLLDEGFFIYAEEVDWCMRMRAAGWPALCAPAVVVTHHEAQSTRQFKEGMFVALWKSRLRLFAKHYPPAFNWAARRLLRLGLARLRRQAQAERRAGALDEPTFIRRLTAFDDVERMSRAPAA